MIQDNKMRKGFFEQDPKPTGNKSKKYIQNYVKLNSFCRAKKTLKRMQRQLAEWEQYL